MTPFPLFIMADGRGSWNGICLGLRDGVVQATNRYDAL